MLLSPVLCFISFLYLNVYVLENDAPIGKDSFMRNNHLGIINFAKHFQNFIDDTMICFLNSKLDLNLSCAKDFRNLISMVTWFIN